MTKLDLVSVFISKSCDPMDCSPSSSSFLGILQARIYCSGFSVPSPGDHPYPGIEPGSPALQVDSLPSEPPRKHQTGFSNLFKKSFWKLSLKRKGGHEDWGNT